MSILNDIEKIRETDPENLYNQIFDFPEQIEKAFKIADSFKIMSEDFAGITNIAVIGMGGSAIGADLVGSFLSGKLLVPFQVCRNYKLPEYIDDESLVIASSYSGDTEETLSALDDAIERKAMIVGITTGGMMADVAGLNSIPLIIIPQGLQPRSALAYSFVILIILLEKIGLIKNASAEIKAVGQKLKGYRENYVEAVPIDKNMAKRLAQRLTGTIPLIYSGPTLTDSVAYRWKCQICENAKILSFANQFPEFNHNELVGYSDFLIENKDLFKVIFLRDQDDHPQIKSRMDIVKGIIEEMEIEVIEIYSRGDQQLERMLSLIQLGDYLSYYLAIASNNDPSPIKIINSLKELLSARK